MSERSEELRIEDWQQLAARETTPKWAGDFSDDCKAEWAGLYLRAEWMDGTNWWWSVSDLRTQIEINSSSRHEQRYESGEDARKAAENAAREFLGA